MEASCSAMVLHLQYPPCTTHRAFIHTRASVSQQHLLTYMLTRRPRRRHGWARGRTKHDTPKCYTEKAPNAFSGMPPPRKTKDREHLQSTQTTANRHD